MLLKHPGTWLLLFHLPEKVSIDHKTLNLHEPGHFTVRALVNATSFRGYVNFKYSSESTENEESGQARLARVYLICVWVVLLCKFVIGFL